MLAKILLSLLCLILPASQSFAGTWNRSHIYTTGEILTAGNLNTSLDEGANAVNDITGTNLDAALSIVSTGSINFSGNATLTGAIDTIGNGTTSQLYFNTNNDIEYSEAATWTLNAPQTISGIWANLGTVQNITMTGGTINGTEIGAAVPNTGEFTSAIILGNVGIGSVNPGQILDVQGTIRTNNFNMSGSPNIEQAGASLVSDAFGNAKWAVSTFGFNNKQTFTSSGTWTNPGHVTIVFVQIWGDGGGGSYGQGSSACYSGGGGNYVEGLVSVTGNATVTIGTGGSPGTSGSTSGSAGTGSSVAGTNTITAGGGGGGTTSGPGAGGTASGSYSFTSVGQTGNGPGFSTLGGKQTSIYSLLTVANAGNTALGGQCGSNSNSGSPGSSGLAFISY